jgi:hypothetical protein
MTLKERVAQLEKEIRYCRDQRGDDLCWMDFERLYKLLPEGYIPPKRDSKVMLSNCRKFIKCYQNPATTYVSPQRRIEELEKAVKELVGVCHLTEMAMIGLAPAPEAWKACQEAIKKYGDGNLPEKKATEKKKTINGDPNCKHLKLHRSFVGDQICEDCGMLNP